MKSPLKVAFLNGFEKYFKVLIFFELLMPIYYTDLIKAKERK